MYPMRVIRILCYIIVYGTKTFGLAPPASDRNPELLKYSPFQHDHLEVSGLHNNTDEDIFYLRRRGEDDCKTNDCVTYSGWGKDDTFSCQDEDEEQYGDDKIVDPDRPLRSLVRREPKRAGICKNVEVDGKEVKEGIEFRSPDWPAPSYLEDKYKRVYDIGNPTNPSQSEWYQLKRFDQRWPTDIDGRKDKNGNPMKRCYAAEHVLEWQLILLFLEHDKARNDGTDSICVLLHKYFNQEKMPRDDIDVKKVKDHEKILGKGDRFEYEDTKFKFSQFKGKDGREPRPIDWIVMQWPGKQGPQAKPPSPWEYELVLLNDDLNNKKADIWAENNIFAVPKLEKDGKTLRKIETNSKTMEALFENKYYEKSQDKKWDNNRGKCKAVYRFTTIMSLVTYHNDPYIQEVMRAQVRRVGEAFEYLETTILPNLEWEDSLGKKHPYKAVGLKDTWLEWMKARHKNDLETLNKVLEEKVDLFKGTSKLIAKVKRWDFAGIFSKRENELPNCGFEKDDKNMKERVDLMLAEYQKLGKAETELDLEMEKKTDSEPGSDPDSEPGSEPDDPNDPDYHPDSDPDPDNDSN